jgi:homopolymeric O-antigen transport system ATP-binding protein
LWAAGGCSRGWRSASLTSSEQLLAIEARDLHKEYRLGELADLRHATQSAVNRLRHAPHTSPTAGVLSALDGVSFSLPVGELCGVMGPNGSGKSTLVQIISSITVPTSGVINIRGRVLPLLEVGAVFHDDLTGRENVVLFGTILGVKRREIMQAMPRIAEFGGIDRWHMDTPLKRHSTGMRARLSFAVAMSFPADVYIFDEVIAVVDDQFRSVAIEEIRALHQSGRTVIFVSHDLDLVRSLCTVGMWLANGHLRAFGPIADVADQYVASQKGTRAHTAPASP